MNITKHVWMMPVPVTLEETVNVSAQQWLPTLKHVTSWTSAYPGEPHPFAVSFNPLLFLRGSEGKKTEGKKETK